MASIDWPFELGVAGVTAGELVKNVHKAQDTNEAEPRKAFLLVVRRHAARLIEQVDHLTATPEPEAPAPVEAAAKPKGRGRKAQEAAGNE